MINKRVFGVLFLFLVLFSGILFISGIIGPGSLESVDKSGDKGVIDTIKGLFSDGYYKFVKPLVMDTIVYPLIGVKEGEAVAKSFSFFGLIGFLAGIISLGLLYLLNLSGFFSNTFINDFFQKVSLFKIPIFAVVFGVFYGVLMLVPILNRALEIVSLQIFTYLLPDNWAEFITRTFLLSLTIIILFLLPSIAEKLWISKIRMKNIEALHKEVAMKEAQRESFKP